MIPAFTNKKRQNSYYNHPKQGFNYINWDMENELYLFQTQIEQKFRKSTMNKTYKFPMVQPKTVGRVDGPLALPNGIKQVNMASAGTPESQKQQPRVPKLRFFSPQASERVS